MAVRLRLHSRAMNNRSVLSGDANRGQRGLARLALIFAFALMLGLAMSLLAAPSAEAQMASSSSASSLVEVTQECVDGGVDIDVVLSGELSGPLVKVQVAERVRYVTVPPAGLTVEKLGVFASDTAHRVTVTYVNGPEIFDDLVPTPNCLVEVSVLCIAGGETIELALSGELGASLVKVQVGQQVRYVSVPKDGLTVTDLGVFEPGVEYDVVVSYVNGPVVFDSTMRAGYCPTPDEFQLREACTSSTKNPTWEIRYENPSDREQTFRIDTYRVDVPPALIASTTTTVPVGAGTTIFEPPGLDARVAYLVEVFVENGDGRQTDPLVRRSFQCGILQAQPVVGCGPFGTRVSLGVFNPLPGRITVDAWFGPAEWLDQEIPGQTNRIFTAHLASETGREYLVEVQGPKAMAWATTLVAPC